LVVAEFATRKLRRFVYGVKARLLLLYALSDI